MPFESEKQRKFIYAKADEGEKWAKKFIKDVKNNDGPNAPKGMKVKKAKNPSKLVGMMEKRNERV